MRVDPRDFVPLFDFDFAGGDELGGADVDVVAPAAVEVFGEEAGAFGAVVESEAGGLEGAEEGGVAFVDFFGGVLFEAGCDGVGG